MLPKEFSINSPDSNLVEQEEMLLESSTLLPIFYDRCVPLNYRVMLSMKQTKNKKLHFASPPSFNLLHSL